MGEETGEARALAAALAACGERGARPLLVAVAGSRAWGYAAPGSDYDVKVVFALPPARCLSLEPPPEVFRSQSPDFEVEGWGLRKFLTLGRAANPTALEWLSAPALLEDPRFKASRAAVAAAFRPGPTLRYHAGQARAAWGKRLEGERPDPKGYLILLRSACSALWAARLGTMPPPGVRDVVGAVAPEALPWLEGLLSLRVSLGAGTAGRRVPALDAWWPEADAELAEAEAACAGGEPLPPVGPFDEALLVGLGLAEA